MQKAEGRPSVRSPCLHICREVGYESVLFPLYVVVADSGNGRLVGAVVCVDAEDSRSISSIESTVAVYVKAEDIVYICVIFICYLLSLSLVL